MLIGVLVLALVCLALGVMLSSAPWLLASLVTSAVAAFLLVRMRGRGSSSTRPGTDTDRRAEHGEERENGISGRGQAGLLSGSAFAGSGAEPSSSAAIERSDPGDPAEPAGSSDDDHRDGDGAVWVVDGRPEYHAEGCERLTDADAEQIPRSQATEDGFVGCDSCRPDPGAAEQSDSYVSTPAHEQGKQPGSPTLK